MARTEQQEADVHGVECQRCNGARWVDTRHDGYTISQQCPQCEGDGRVVVAAFRFGRIRITHVIPARFHPARTA